MKSKSFYTAKKTMYSAKKQLQNERNFLSTIHLKGSYCLQSIRNLKNRDIKTSCPFIIWTNGSNIQFSKEDTQETGEMAQCVKSPCANMKTWFGCQHPHKTNRNMQAHLREWLCLCSQSNALKSGTRGSLGPANCQLSPVPVRGPVSREYGRH